MGPETRIIGRKNNAKSSSVLNLFRGHLGIFRTGPDRQRASLVFASVRFQFAQRLLAEPLALLNIADVVCVLPP